MRKVKIMLTAMIVLGIVGGVLAFKERRDVGRCTAAVPIGGNCSNVKCLAGALLAISPIGVEKCYKTTSNTANCSADNRSCTARNSFVPN